MGKERFSMSVKRIRENRNKQNQENEKPLPTIVVNDVSDDDSCSDLESEKLNIDPDDLVEELKNDEQVMTPERPEHKVLIDERLSENPFAEKDQELMNQTNDQQSPPSPPPPPATVIQEQVIEPVTETTAAIAAEKHAQMEKDEKRLSELGKELERLAFARKTIRQRLQEEKDLVENIKQKELLKQGNISSEEFSNAKNNTVSTKASKGVKPTRRRGIQPTNRR